MDATKRRGRTSSARTGAFLALLAVAVLIAVVPATGKNNSRTVEVTPGDGLVDSQYVAVTFSGFPAKQDVRIRECPAGAKKIKQCNQDSPYASLLREAGDSRLPRSSASGAGGDSFIVKAGELTDQRGDSFKCDVEHSCDIVAFETKQTGDYSEIGFDAAKAAKIPFAKSTVSCPRPTGSNRVAGSGASSAAAAVVEWQAETCRDPLNLHMSYIVTNSPQGKQSFLDGLTDSEFALSGIGLTDDEKKTLTDASREGVQIPVTVSGLSFVYNYYEDLDRCDSDTHRQRVTSLRLSPATLAYIMTGRLSNMADARIAADNPDLLAQTRNEDECDKPADHLPPRAITPVGRADQSAATWNFSSWMLATAHDDWASAGEEFQKPTEVFPSYNAVQLRTGSAAVARQIRTFDGGQRGPGDTPEAMWIGFVDSSVARQVGLPAAALENAAGSFVQPTTESILAGLAAATPNTDGTVTPNYMATSPNNAYPLLNVTYLITDKHKLTNDQASVLKAFAAYAITTGQDDAEKRGYAPLPSEMRTSAAASIDSIEGTGGSGDGNGDGNGNGNGSGSGSGSGNGSGGSNAGSGGTSGDTSGGVTGGSSGDSLGSFTNRLLGQARGSSQQATSAADASPIQGSLASQKLGPAGGPGGVVRALTVFLGLPMLLLLGLLSIVGGRVLSVLSAREGRLDLRALIPIGQWRRAI